MLLKTSRAHYIEQAKATLSKLIDRIEAGEVMAVAVAWAREDGGFGASIEYDSGRNFSRSVATAAAAYVSHRACVLLDEEADQ